MSHAHGSGAAGAGTFGMPLKDRKAGWPRKTRRAGADASGIPMRFTPAEDKKVKRAGADAPGMPLRYKST